MKRNLRYVRNYCLKNQVYLAVLVSVLMVVLWTMVVVVAASVRHCGSADENDDDDWSLSMSSMSPSEIAT